MKSNPHLEFVIKRNHVLRRSPIEADIAAGYLEAIVHAIERGDQSFQISLNGRVVAAIVPPQENAGLANA